MTQLIDNKIKESRLASEALPSDFATRQADSLGTREAIAARLKQARQSLGFTQKEAATRAGIPLSSYKDYEAAKKTPGGDAIASITLLGINANWLLTGDRPMLLAKARKQTIAGLNDEYDEFGKAFAEALGLTPDDLLQASDDVGVAMEGKLPDENNFEGTYPKYRAQVLEAYLNAAKSLVRKSPLFGVAQTDASAPPANTLDPARLRLAIETVEEGLAATQRTMTPEKKAELVTAVYDLFADDTSAQAKGKVLRLVKLAA